MTLNPVATMFWGRVKATFLFVHAQADRYFTQEKAKTCYFEVGKKEIELWGT